MESRYMVIFFEKEFVVYCGVLCCLLFRAAEASNRIVLLHLHYDTRFVSKNCKLK